jgi:hypothetical protein
MIPFLPSIFDNPFLLITLAVFGVLPGYFVNKYLLKLTRPKESVVRFLAYLVILAAFTLFYTCIAIVILTKFYFKLP